MVRLGQVQQGQDALVAIMGAGSRTGTMTSTDAEQAVIDAGGWGGGGPLPFTLEQTAQAAVSGVPGWVWLLGGVLVIAAVAS